jgi:NADH-quinone oxidoreductase subunit E
MRIERIANTKTTDQEIHSDLHDMELIFKKYRGKSGSLIPLLQATQQKFGYIPLDALRMIAAETGVPEADIYGVTTFYAQFRLHPVGKHIVKVCHGTACHVQNAGDITAALRDELKVKDGGTTDDGLFTLESVACLGCCSLAPVMMIGENTYGKLSGKAATRVIREIRKNETASEE